MKKKVYSEPKVERVKLVAKEAIIGACKTASDAFFSMGCASSWCGSSPVNGS